MHEMNFLQTNDVLLDVEAKSFILSALRYCSTYAEWLMWSENTYALI